MNEKILNMKSFFLTLYLGIVISFFGSCNKDNHEIVPAFNYEQGAGIWVPYEVTEFDTTYSISQTTTGIFGSYSASVRLNKDQTFIPVVWFDKDNFVLSTIEAGTFEYIPNTQLRFKGGFIKQLECDIIKFEGDELWLAIHYTTRDALYKFKRQL